MKVPKLSLVLAVGFATVAAAATAPPTHTIELKGSQSTVEFLAIGRPSAIKIRGEAKADAASPPVTGAFTLDGRKLTGTARIKLDSFDTGIDLRNRHMKEKYLETAKYPEAELKLVKLELPEAAIAETFAVEKVPFEAELLLHGQRRPIKGTANLEKKADRIDTGFEFTLTLSDYAIEIPSFMGIKVANDVQVTARCETPLKR